MLPKKKGGVKTLKCVNPSVVNGYRGYGYFSDAFK
jgi:hypothetical protein